MLVGGDLISYVDALPFEAKHRSLCFRFPSKMTNCVFICLFLERAGDTGEGKTVNHC